jgi:hypothetical protein
MAGSTTPDTIPYMTSGDDLAGLDEHTLALANRLQALIGRRGWGGKATAVMGTAGTPVDTAVTIPVNRRGANPPAVVVTPEFSGDPSIVRSTVHSVTASGFTIRTVRSTGTANVPVHWMVSYYDEA